MFLNETPRDNKELELLISLINNSYKDGEIEEDVKYMIRVGQMKWKNTSIVLCDHRNSIKLKGKSYKTTIRLIVLYNIECLDIKKQNIHKMSIVEKRILKWII